MVAETASSLTAGAHNIRIANWFIRTIQTFITLAARGLEEPCSSFPDFCNNRQFHVIYCVSSRLCTKNFWFTIHVDSWFWRIIDQICWACVIFRSILNLQACTDRWTDKLIRVGLGNLRFLQVKYFVWVSKKKGLYLVFFIALTTLDVVGTDIEKESDIFGL